MQASLLILILVFTVGCVKDEGKISEGNSSGDTTGGTTGGSSGTPGTPDPLVSEAWHLNSTGTQKGFSSTAATSGEDINLGGVHSILDILGRNVRIAVSDSGVDIEHPDLNDNALTGEHRNYTFSDPSAWADANSSPIPSDDDAHGTGVTGLISSEKDNGLGSHGVAPLSKFSAFRYIFSDSSSITSRLAKTIDQTYGNFDIFNYSYGFAGYFFVPVDETLEEAFELGATTLRAGKGSLYIQSSGNSYDNEEYLYCDPDDPMGPGAACYVSVAGNSNAHTDMSTPFKLIVGATNAAGVKATYSTPGSSLWIAAPGGEYGISTPAMITTDIRGCNAGFSYRDQNQPTLFNFGLHALNGQCDYTNIFNGTSSAAPVTSGVVALMLEANPNLSWRDVKHILAETADPIDFDAFDNVLFHPHGANPFGLGYVYDMKWVLNNAGYMFSNWYGFGRVDAEEAVNMALSYDLSTLGTFVQTKNSIDTWYYDSGDLTGEGYTITDESPTTLADHRIWVGHNFLVESVQIKITSDHPYPGDLAIHLISPNNTESRVLTLNNGIYGDPFDDFVMASNAFYGEESEGFWRIQVYDGNTALEDSGELINWKILVSGRKPTGDVLNPEPPTFISLGAIPAVSNATPIFNFSDSESQATLSDYEAAVGTNEGNEAIVPWTSIGLGTTGHQFTGLSLNSGQTYYLKIRSRQGTRYSSTQLITWEAN